MWQRIQTLFLVSAIVCLAASIFLPIWAIRDEAGVTSHVLYAFHYSTFEKATDGTTAQAASYMPYAVTACLIVAALTIAIIEIGKSSNRLLQLKLGALNSLFIAGAMASAVYFAIQMTNTHAGGSYGFGMYLPFGAAISNFLANQFIRRDEKIVRDSDRLR
jgi:hypothetical protein